MKNSTFNDQSERPVSGRFGVLRECGPRGAAKTSYAVCEGGLKSNIFACGVWTLG